MVPRFILVLLIASACFSVEYSYATLKVVIGESVNLTYTTDDAKVEIRGKDFPSYAEVYKEFYDKAKIESRGPSQLSLLNALGKKGWRVVHVDQTSAETKKGREDTSIYLLESAK